MEKSDLAIVGEVEHTAILHRLDTAWAFVQRQRLAPQFAPVLDDVRRLLACYDETRAALARLEAARHQASAARDLADAILAEVMAQRDRLASELLAAEAERDAARAALDGLLADVEHFAIIQHRALHGPPGVRDPDRPPSAAWRDCRRDGCPGLRRAVARARAATGHGGAG